MLMVQCSNQKVKGSNVWSALMILALVTGVASLARAQDEVPGASGAMRDTQASANRVSLASALEGSWMFDIEVLNQGIKFQSLISFGGGGIVVTSASLPGPSTTPYYGTWRQSGPNRFNAVFYGFVPDASGVAVGLSKVNLSMKLTGRNTLTGTAVGMACDLQGNNCVATGEHQNTGTRIVPE